MTDPFGEGVQTNEIEREENHMTRREVRIGPLRKLFRLQRFRSIRSNDPLIHSVQRSWLSTHILFFLSSSRKRHSQTYTTRDVWSIPFIPSFDPSSCAQRR